MALDGIDSITYGVTDLPEGRRFFDDWGLRCTAEDADRVVMETLDGGRVVLRHQHDPALPPAFEDGPTLREMIWGAADQAELQTTLRQVGTFSRLETGSDGVARCTDPNGLRVGFRVSRRRPPGVSGAPVNTVDSINRVDRPAPVYRRAEPCGIGHVVLFTDKLEPLEAFYREALGFQVSDRYPGRGVFLRCQPRGGHHNLFLLQLPNNRVGLNHVAFVVRDIHEVFGGGLHVSRCGWQTEIGPGRHPISSAYFWYVKNPCGGAVEYYADEDHLTAAWRPRELQPSNENFAEWAVDGGIDGHTRRQAFSPSAAD